MLLQNPINKVGKYARTVQTLIEFNIRVAQNPSKRVLGKWLTGKLQRLGPTYIKIGQFMSSRKDIFGDDFAEELSALRDDVQPMNDAEFAAAVESYKYRHMFNVIEKKPIASASIGQVHIGVLKDGRKVILKLKRPDIEMRIREDIEFLMGVLSLMQMLNLENIQDSIDLVSDFERSVAKEVDFIAESKNMKAFYDTYHSAKSIIIPSVYPQLCASNVIVMEYVESLKISEYTGDRKALATKLMDFFIGQLINYGLVHGDPHEGNLGVTKNGAIVMYDFGNIVRIPLRDRQHMKELIYFLLISNKSGVIQTLKSLKIKITNEKEMTRYIDLYIEYMRTIDISQLQSSHGPNVKLPLKLTDDLFRLIRVYGILEGICKELDKDFNYFTVLSGYINEIFMDEEFILFKIQNDTASLFGSSTPLSNENMNSMEGTTITDKQSRSSNSSKHPFVSPDTPVLIDTNLVRFLLTSNAILLLWNLVHV
jgi:ubiquinone biosynthesis protein